jgi:hypothetical protein
MAKRRWRHRARGGEDVVARAARLGITEDRVLEECHRIAFSNISQIVAWDADGKLTAKTGLPDEQLAAIAEIVASASTGLIYRVKLHDKKPMLELLGCCLGMLPGATEVAEQDAVEPLNDIEDPREFIIHELDLADAERAARSNPRAGG